MESFEKLAQDLQRQLALAELVDSTNSFDGNISLLLVRLQKMELRMSPDKNHLRPHLHIDYKDGRHVASYAVDSAKCLVGSVRRRDHKVVVSWITDKRPELLTIWDELKAGGDVKAKEVIASLSDDH